MKAIIVDDEAAARAIVEQLCSTIENIELVGEFPNAMQAIKYLNKETVDVVFLDIHMPDFTGFDFIETLKDPPQIILTTSDPNFALNAFEYSCIIDYLTKPITKDRFQKAIQKIKTTVTSKKEITTETSDEDLYVNIDRRLVKIKVPSIYLIEAKGDYIQIKTETKNHTVHTTLKKIEEKLPESLFLKVHRSYIINTSKIVDIEDNSILIKKEVIPVSRGNREALMERLNLL